MNADIEAIRKLFIYNQQSHTLHEVAANGQLNQIEISDCECNLYPRNINNKTLSISRIVWILTHGEILDGMCVTHIDSIYDHRLTNLKLISRKGISARNRTGISPIKNKNRYGVGVHIKNGVINKFLNLGSYDSHFQANKICKKYNALFGFEMEFGTLRDDLTFEEFRKFVREKITPDYEYRR